MNGWHYLAIAIAFEIIATLCLKQSEGLQNLTWVSASVFLYIICFWAFALALDLLPIGPVYAISSGVGILAIAIIGTVFLSDKLTMMQYGFIALILIGAVGLQLTTKSAPS
ncbi:MAG: SMR family transporter [Hyphomonadaceae bacterium]